jgi:hypothetical protein
MRQRNRAATKTGEQGDREAGSPHQRPATEHRNELSQPAVRRQAFADSRIRRPMYLRYARTRSARGRTRAVRVSVP